MIRLVLRLWLIMIDYWLLIMIRLVLRLNIVIPCQTIRAFGRFGLVFEAVVWTRSRQCGGGPMRWQRCGVEEVCVQVMVILFVLHITHSCTYIYIYRICIHIYIYVLLCMWYTLYRGFSWFRMENPSCSGVTPMTQESSIYCVAYCKHQHNKIYISYRHYIIIYYITIYYITMIF